MAAAWRDDPTGRPVLPTLDLIRGAQGGDPLALEHLYERYLPRMRRWARGRLPAYARDGMETQDIVQDAMLRTVRKLEALDAQSAGCFQAYTRQAILNAIRDQMRRAKPRAPVSVALDRFASPGPSPLEEAIGEDALDRYESALARLTPLDQEMVIARLEMHYSFQEIADFAGKASADAARMAVHRALLTLAKEMGE